MDEQEWLAGYQSPPPETLLPDPVNTPGSVQRHDPNPEPLDLGPSGSEADALAEAHRLAENERFKIWEDGFMAGLHSVNGEHRTNPYQWHGIGFVPLEADLGDIRVRVFIGSQEVKVGEVGPITRDRRGTQIDCVFIHPEPGTR